MKILLVHGQNHKGTTYHMGRIVAEELARPDEITEFFLPRDLNHFCLGCYTCIEDETRCPFWNGKEKILEAMEQADVFIFTTPNYCLAPSGAMKSFLDLFFDMWMVHRPKEWMFKKKAVVLTASAGASCKKTICTVKDSLFYWGVPVIETYGLPVQAANWGMVKPEKRSKLENDMKKIAAKLRKKEAVSVGIKTKCIFKAMQMMHKKGWDSSPVEREYWDQHGWLGKERPWKN